MVALDIPNIQAKAMDFMRSIDDLESNANVSLTITEIERLMDKLKAYRKAGLEDEGEFSTENLVFKVLRNTGYLEKVADMKQDILTKNLTLENVSMYDGDIARTINEVGMGDKVRQAVRGGTLALGMVVALLATGISSQEAVKNFQIPEELVQKAEEFISNPYIDLGLTDKTTEVEKTF